MEEDVPIKVAPLYHFLSFFYWLRFTLSCLLFLTVVYILSGLRVILSKVMMVHTSELINFVYFSSNYWSILWFFFFSCLRQMVCRYTTIISSWWRDAVWVDGSALTLKRTFPHPFLSDLLFSVWPRVLVFSLLELWEQSSKAGSPGFVSLSKSKNLVKYIFTPLSLLLSFVGIWGQDLDFCHFWRVEEEILKSHD